MRPPHFDLIRIPVIAVLLITAVLTGCSGGSSREPADDNPPTPTPSPAPGVTPTPGPDPSNPPEDVFISGTVTYEHVPHRENSGALYYLGAEPRPVRGATLQLLDAGNTLLRETRTDENGGYRVGAPENTNVRIRVLAELESTEGARYWFRVTDNTDGNSLYALDGSLASSGTQDSGRDLFAPSGWDTSLREYTTTRAAAPFAILDSLYSALELLVPVDPDIDLSYTEMRWSVDNRAVSGNTALGHIGTSSYYPDENVIYILGHANNDTDEYDASVIVHEFAHYLENTISRADNIGGNHGIDNDKLDPRVAFSEAWGNAFASMVLNDEFYRDSGGPRQDVGLLIFSLEENEYDSSGWYNENAVQQVIYDLFDENNESENGDNLTLGFSPLYNTVTSPSLVQDSAFVTIYSFSEELKTISDSGTGSEIDSLMESHGIFGKGRFGENETNDGGLSRNLPVYQPLALGESITFCTGNDFGEYNKLDNREFFTISVAQSGGRELQLTMNNRTGGSVDGTTVIHFAGEVVEDLQFSTNSSTTRTFNLASAGTYIVEYFEDQNIDEPFNMGTFGATDCSPSSPSSTITIY